MYPTFYQRENEWVAVSGTIAPLKAIYPTFYQRENEWAAVRARRGRAPPP